MNRLSCAFLGQRPSTFSFGFDEEHPKCQRLKEKIREQIYALADNGVLTFLSGMSQGMALWGAEIALEMQKINSRIKLICILPCETQANKWAPFTRERYFNVLSKSDDVFYISKRYQEDCIQHCNRSLIDHSHFILAVYDGHSGGSIAQSIQYALMSQKAVIVIHPETGKVIPFTVHQRPS